MKRFGRFRLLHLSDFHFSEPGSGHKLATYLTRSLDVFRRESSAGSDGADAVTEISAVVLSGDFRQQRAARNDSVDWKVETNALVDGIAKGFGWSHAERSRILMVPGNHDATRLPIPEEPRHARTIEQHVAALTGLLGSRDDVAIITAELGKVASELAEAESKRYRHFRPDWTEYNDFARAYYENVPNMTAIPVGSEKGAPVAYIADHRDDLGVCFVLMNAYAGATTFPDDTSDEHKRVQLPGAVGKTQLELLADALSKSDFDKELHHTVVVLHHHLFPMRRGGGAQDLARRDILTDLPDLADWMQRWNTACVLHGHRHRPFLGVFRVIGISDWLNNDLLGEQSDNEAFDNDYELVACGIGQALHEEDRPAEAPGDRRVLLPSLQVVDVTPDPHRFFEARIVVFPFQLDHTKWRAISGPTVPKVYASELVLPEIQRRLFEAECFAGDEVSLRTHYPLIPSTAEPQYQHWFMEPFGKAVKTVGSLFSTPHREAFFQHLIENIRQANKEKSIFTVLPFQLAGLYAYASLFFTQEEVHAQAIEEFQEPQWRPLLSDEPSTNDLRPEWLTNHLESANYYIAQLVRDYWRGVEDSNGQNARANGPIRIIDLGAGTGRTIRRIVAALDECPVPVQYRGIEISGALAQEADLLLKRFTRNYRLAPLGAGELVVQGEICACLLTESAAEWFHDIDCVVASYCIHHIPNNYRVWKTLADGSLFDIVDPRHFSGEHEEEPISLREALETGTLFGDVPNDKKTQFLDYLYEVFAWWRIRNFGRNDRHTDAPELAKKVFEFLPNRQIQLYRSIYAGLTPGGLLIVADPNGFSSTFNRVNIFSDWRMAIAHFAEWTLLARWLSEIGFVEINVIRQMRRKNLGVVEERVPADWVNRICRGEPVDLTRMFGGGMKYEGLEIEDQHLGYIVSAMKPR